jgi:hypothetical protein
VSYTYKIVYELTERLTDDQLAAMQQILDKPWTPPPGYEGEVIKARIYRYHCDSDVCSECLECTPVASEGDPES